MRRRILAFLLCFSMVFSCAAMTSLAENSENKQEGTEDAGRTQDENAGSVTINDEDKKAPSDSGEDSSSGNDLSDDRSEETGASENGNSSEKAGSLEEGEKSSTETGTSTEGENSAQTEKTIESARKSVARAGGATEDVTLTLRYQERDGVKRFLAYESENPWMFNEDGNHDKSSDPWPGGATSATDEKTDEKLESILAELYAGRFAYNQWAGQTRNIVQINIWMETTYEVTGDNRETWGAKLAPNLSTPRVTLLRNQGFDEPLIKVSTDTDRYLHITSNVFIDNAAALSNAPDATVAVQVADGGLAILDGAVIYDSTVENGSLSTRTGTGVLITTTKGKQEPVVEGDGGALELRGASVIRDFRIGVDQDYGKTRLQAGSYRIDENTVSVNLAYGNSMGKWAEDISGISPVHVTLEEVERWRSGDHILASGYIRTGDASTETKVNVVPADEAKIKIVNADSTAQHLDLEYYAGDTKYPYPVIRFTNKPVYNVRLNKWYSTLYDAVNDNSVEDNDEIVFYGNTNEERTVEIKHNLTIRSSYKSEAPDGKADERAGGDYTAKWSLLGDDETSAITVAEGKTVTFAPADSDKDYGTLTLDAGEKGRVIENNGTVNLNDNIIVANGKVSGNGGGVLNNGTLNMAGGMVSNCSAGLGDGIYQDGIFNLSGAPVFSGNVKEDVYLPATAVSDMPDGFRVITKAGEFTFTGALDVTLGNSEDNLYDGRNVVESSSGSPVVDTDLSKFQLTNKQNSEVFSKFDFIYNLNDATGNANKGNAVLELEIERVIKDQKLTITKTVAGNASEKDKKFDFTLTLKKDGTAYTEALPYTRKEGTSQSLAAENDVYKFALGDGDEIELTIPRGCEYTIAEQNEDYAVEINGTKSGDAKATGTLIKDTTVAYKNIKNIAPPTGLSHTVLPFALMLASVLGAAILLALFGRRRCS